MGVEQASGVAHVAVLPHIEARKALPTRLVVLVEGPGSLQAVALADGPLAAQARRVVVVALRHVGGAVHRAAEEAQAGSEAQALRRVELHAVARLPGVVAEDVGEGARVGGAFGIVDVVAVGRGAREGQRVGVEALTQALAQIVALLVVVGVAAVGVERPGHGVLTRDDVDDAAGGAAAVERRSGALNDLHTLHIVHREAREVDVVQGLARQRFAVNQEEDAQAGEAREVHRDLLVHGVGELHAGQLRLQEVLNVGGVGLENLLARDDARLYGRLLKQSGRARARHHDGVERGDVAAPEGVLQRFGVARARKPARKGRKQHYGEAAHHGRG